ncbi:MAG TPA: YraN family protein [Leptolyngbyaceae cyanobacterium M33_DOE_097]|uniref:UPF0102 protein ENR64_15145 n=1 Tax=Oscillatoriales cyanobacterium SpSt-418 TaxID=2282169 RepID=A0A7C3PIT2_9CYAN|nr:YraN family protein [Leptolyngbyaceae cyanobacterium M33_DOE_097]
MLDFTDVDSSHEPGLLGEIFVAEWLTQAGWQPIAHRWHCRWGELDLVAVRRANETSAIAAIAFVEVKTRRQHNWDAHGALAITAKKQSKLWRTAQLYLVENPAFEALPCQFDVALVTYQPVAITQGIPQHATRKADWQFWMQTYIPHAFALN